MTVKEASVQYFNLVAENLVDQQIKLGMFASGKSARDIKIIQTAKGARMELPEAWYYQIHGRAPGKMPPIQKMIAYIAVKRIEASPWALAKYIAKNGTAIWRKEKKGIDLQKAKDVGLKELKKEIGKSYVEQIRNKFNNVIINS